MAALPASGGLDWLGAASNVLGGALGGRPAPSMAYADSIFGVNKSFDNSGWNVAFSGSRIDSVSEKEASQNSSPSVDRANNQINGYLPYVVLFVGGLIAWRMLKK